MLAIAMGITMSVLDTSVANVALPTIARELRASPSDSVWIISSYQLSLVIAILPLASLGERIGFRRIYQGGLLVFTTASLACALSHSLAALVIARTAQGFGAAGILSVNGALVSYTYPKALLGRGIGLNALVVSAGTALGPSIASGILAVAPWEWLFAVNVPIGVVNLLLAARVLPYSQLSEQRFDWISAALAALTFGFFFIGLDTFAHGGAQGGRLAWLGVAAAQLAGAAIAGVVLFSRATEAEEPLIPLDLMRIPLFALSVATSVCSFVAYMLAFVALPFYFETVLHRDQVQTGLLMTPWPMALGLLAPIAGRLSDRLPAAILGTVGLTLLAGGLGLLATLPAQPSVWAILWRMALCGAGFGLFQTPNNRTLLSVAPRRRAGAAGGMLATARLVGLTLGAALAAMVFQLMQHDAETTDLLLGAGFAVLAAIVSGSRLLSADPRAAGSKPARSQSR